MNQQRGFTLIELMVTIAILAILAAIAYPSYIDYIRKGRLEDARATIVDNIKLVERYYGVAKKFECDTNFAKNIGATCNGNVLAVDTTNSKSAEKYYDFAISLPSAAHNINYIITATPKAGVYSESTLSNQKLYLVYHSGSSSYSKCNKTGVAAVLKAGNTNDNCTAL